ncbi:methyl-accepting chemotaxis protein [Andreprevotia chitinilytica]|uniref:methyl-accepting chemotaxis protein n=1 Tax=Andreprevotia chitinilytica TaxID=396808 RepID=UPI00054FCAA5|nr:methyl-accepting chemotaxis protein [Andreprevotia chitinilytica]
MTIAKRLVLLLSVAVLGLLLVAGLGIYQMGKVYTAANFSTVNTVPSLKDLDSARGAFGDVSTQLYRMAGMVDPVKRAKVEELILAGRAKLEEALKTYEKNDLANDKDRALLAADWAALHEHDQPREKAMALLRDNHVEEAREQLVGPGSAAAGKLKEALTAHIQYNIDLGNQGDQDAQATRKNAVMLAVSISLATLLVVITLGVLTYRKISGGLRNAQETIAGVESTLDFTRRATVSGNDEIAQTLQAFNQLIGTIQSNLRSLREGALDVAQTSSELLGASQQVARSSTAQSESSSHMAASVEQITVSINHVAERAGEASQLSGSVGQKAENGQQVIGQTSSDIHAIAAAVETVASEIGQLDIKSKEIASVVHVIKDVADQTNLLALNAAIEAARAGETGRGFAVVADEVRKLAERTASATVEIGTIIGAIQAVSGNAVRRMADAVAQVEQGVTGASTAQQSMTDIHAASGQSVQVANEISVAIREQGMATTTIAQQVEKVAQMAEANSSASTQAASLAGRLEEISDNMKRIVSTYSL